MIVMKFGGSSLGTSDALTRVVGVIAERVSRMPVVVVSAIGKTTDRLLAVVEQAADGRQGEARRSVAALRDDLLDTVAPVLSDVPAFETLLDRHVEENRPTADRLAGGRRGGPPCGDGCPRVARRANLESGDDAAAAAARSRQRACRCP